LRDLQSLQPDSVLGVFKAHKQFHDLALSWIGAGSGSAAGD
jgi:hypothetical protein